MHPFKFKLKREAAEGLKEIIEKVLPQNHETLEDKMLMATLAEIASAITDKLQPYKLFKAEFSMKISPAQAFALLLFYVDYIDDTTSYIGNQLHTISNKIRQQYTINII